MLRPTFCTVLLVLLPSLAQAQAELVHQIVDQQVSASDVQQNSKVASDPEFLRRVYLDLIGRSPTVDETRTFLQKTSTEKRAKLIDELLASEEFNDFFANVLDLIFMERRGGNRVAQAEWKSFLRRSIAEQQPLDRIVRSILTADGDGPNRGAAKFVLERDVEPNALTRDISRILMGRDLQCAQCHDHPNIGDYSQAEYYGIYAFVSRSYLFEDPADNKKAYIGEKADGRTEFKSVFDPDDDGSTTIPVLLGDMSLDAEPRYEGESAYVVAPSKNTAGVPRFSRRVQLARLITDPRNKHFARNAVNRLWAHMMGKGIVHPVDFVHSDNPPTHPELLELLAESFTDMNFDIREFLRQVALSDTYQRSIDFPTPEDSSERLQQHLAAISGAAETSNDAIAQAQRSELSKRAARRVEKARNELAEIDAQITSAAEAIGNLPKQRKQLTKAREELQTQLGKKQSQQGALKLAVNSAKKVAELLPKDKALAGAYAELKARAEKLAAEVKQAQQAVTQKKTEEDALATKLTKTQRELARLKAVRVGIADMVAEARGALAVHTAADERDVALQVEEEQRRTAWDVHNAYLEKKDLQAAKREQLALAEKQLVAAGQIEEAVAAAKNAAKHVTQFEADLAARQQQAAATEDALSKCTAALTALDEAVSKIEAAASATADSNLAAAITTLSSQRTSLETSCAAQQQEAEQLDAAVQQARRKWKQSVDRQTDLESQLRSLQDRKKQREAELAQASATYHSAAVETESANEKLRQSWERRYVVRSLKPLTPEQLAGSTIAALGLKERFRRDAEAEWERNNKKKQEKNAKDGAKKDSGGIDPKKREAEIQALQKKRVDQVRSTFVALFAAPAGAPQDIFSSTADQALFFANDGRFQSWLSTSPGGLTHRLTKVTDNEALADELHLSVLCRPATDTEKVRVSQYLQERDKDRRRAIQELAWGLLSSVEFRFNH